MVTDPFVIPIVANQFTSGTGFVDSGCLTYSLTNDRFARRAKLERIPTNNPIPIEGINGKAGVITEIARIPLDIEGRTEEAWAYIVEETLGYDMILGLPWMKKQDVSLRPRTEKLIFNRTKQVVRSVKVPRDQYDHRVVNAAAFKMLARRAVREASSARKKGETKVI
jgi:hypothetical protein